MLSRHRSAKSFDIDRVKRKRVDKGSSRAGRGGAAAVGLSTGGRADSVVGGCDVPIARLVARR